MGSPSIRLGEAARDEAGRARWRGGQAVSRSRGLPPRAQPLRQGRSRGSCPTSRRHPGAASGHAPTSRAISLSRTAAPWNPPYRGSCGAFLLTRHGHQNPASYGTFSRVLHTYVAAGLLPLEEAVRKMTGAPAERLGWKDRGLVRRGCAADLVVLDPARLRDTATFEAPAAFPPGIDHVFMNGVHVLDGGRYDAGTRPGRVLRC